MFGDRHWTNDPYGKRWTNIYCNPCGMTTKHAIEIAECVKYTCQKCGVVKEKRKNDKQTENNNRSARILGYDLL